jgi:hypothetical protein
MKIKLTSCGLGSWNGDKAANKVNVNERDYGPVGRGINLARFHPKTGVLMDSSVIMFDTNGDPNYQTGAPVNENAGKLLLDFVRQHIKEDAIWVVVVIDDATQRLREGLQALQMLGSMSIANIKYRNPFVFCSHISGSTHRVLIDEIGAENSRLTRTAEVVTEDEQQLSEQNRINQAAVAAAQAEALRQQEIARQADIARLAALAAQQKAEQEAAEAKRREQLVIEQQKREQALEHLKKCEEVAASQKKVLSEVFPSLRDTVSFLRNMDRQKVIPEETLREMEQQLLTIKNRLTLKK